MSQSFTATANGRLRELPFECFITSAFDPSGVPVDKHPKWQTFRAIFDTGATNCVITQKVVDACGLKPISMTVVQTANGKHNCEIYVVNIGLPNRVGFPNWRVTKQELPAKTDVLIGMDVIGTGDFAVTHKDGQTVFSFRIPSSVRIDFVAEHNKPRPVLAVPRQERNARCACGSGRKFKNCCGSGAGRA